MSNINGNQRQQRISMLREMFQMDLPDRQKELASAKKLKIDDPSLILSICVR